MTGLHRGLIYGLLFETLAAAAVYSAVAGRWVFALVCVVAFAFECGQLSRRAEA